MTVLSEWSAQLGSLVVGAGTAYVFDGPITGLGVPAPRTSDLDLPTGGTVGGRDLPSPRSIGIPVSVLADTPAAAMTAVDVLLTAWAPTSTDTYLDLCLPGWGTVRYTGRPRGVDLDLSDLQAGNARARLMFDALDPDREPQGS
jgi:hypothetical protein